MSDTEDWRASTTIRDSDVSVSTSGGGDYGARGASLRFSGDADPTAIAETLIALQYRYNVALIARQLRDSPFDGRIAGLVLLIQDGLNEPMQETNKKLSGELADHERMTILDIRQVASVDISFEGAADGIKYIIDTVTPSGRAAKAEEDRHRASTNTIGEDADLEAHRHTKRMNALEEAEREYDLRMKAMDLRDRQLDVAAKERSMQLEMIAKMAVAGVDPALASVLLAALTRTPGLEAETLTPAASGTIHLDLTEGRER